jgi:membrane protein
LNKQNKIRRFFLSIPFVYGILTWAQKRTFPGFDGVPLYDALYFVYKESLKDDISTRANSMAFSFFVALFPGIIFLFSLLPLLPFSADYALMLQDSLESVLPEQAKIWLFSTINDLISIPRGGVLSLGVALTLIFSSNGILAMLRGFEKSYPNTFVERNFIIRRFVAIQLTVMIFILMIITLVLIILGQLLLNELVDFVNLDMLSKFIFSGLRWLTVILLIYSVVSSIYRYGPSLKQKFKFVSPGASIATLLIIISSLAFSFFVNNFGRYNEIYGSIGALIVILIWIQFNCYILLVGFELNASIAVNRDLIQIEDETEDVHHVEK